MIANEPIFSRTPGYLAMSIFALLLAVALSAPPVLAQEQTEEQQQLEQLKQVYAQGVQAASNNETDAAYDYFEEALQLAEATEQSGAAQKIQQYLTQLPRQWGTEALKNEDYETALEHFDRGLESAPDAPTLHYNRGIALINLDREEEAMESLMEAIEQGQATGDQSTAQMATERIQDEYVSRASEVLNAQNPSQEQATQAIEYLDQLEEYVDPDARAYFYRATALYHLDQYEEAIAAARQGLDIFNGSRSDAARYHFVIGESYVALDNIEAAKEEFQQAAFGDYAARAEHYLETL